MPSFVKGHGLERHNGAGGAVLITPRTDGLVDWYLTGCGVAIMIVDAYVDEAPLCRADEEDEREQVKQVKDGSSDPHVISWCKHWVC